MQMAANASQAAATLIPDRVNQAGKLYLGGANDFASVATQTAIKVTVRPR